LEENYQMKISITKNKVITIISIITLLIVWKIVSVLVVSNMLVPSPEETFKALIMLFGSIDFTKHVFFTVFRGVLGFCIALLLAFPLGLWAGVFSGAKAFFQPIIVVMRSTPVVAFILLALIWFSPNNLPVFIAFLTMFPLLYTNIAEGIINVDVNLLEMAKIYNITGKKKIKSIYIPSILPYFFSGATSALGFGWRAIVIGEVLCQPRYGIGTQMHDAQMYLLVSKVIAWTVVAIVISYFFEKIIQVIQKRLVINNE
jgi:NitT/TauT family transport system permease protein